MDGYDLSCAVSREVFLYWLPNADKSVIAIIVGGFLYHETVILRFSRNLIISKRNRGKERLICRTGKMP